MVDDHTILGPEHSLEIQPATPIHPELVSRSPSGWEEAAQRRARLCPPVAFGGVVPRDAVYGAVVPLLGERAGNHVAPLRVTANSVAALPLRVGPAQSVEQENQLEEMEDADEEEEEAGSSEVNLNEMSMWPVFLWLDGLAMFAALIFLTLMLNFIQSIVVGVLIYSALYHHSLLVRKLFLAPSSITTAQILSGSLLIIYYLSSLHSPKHVAPGEYNWRQANHLALGPAGEEGGGVAALEMIVCCDALVCAAACVLKVVTVALLRQHMKSRDLAYLLELQASSPRHPAHASNPPIPHATRHSSPPVPSALSIFRRYR